MHPINKILSLFGVRLSRNGKNSPKRTSSLPKYSYKWLNHVLFDSILENSEFRTRSHYVWGVMQGVNLAHALGIERISVIEFGVAGGNGLVSLENIADKMESTYDVKIDVYGFDTGAGLPKPVDLRDEPHVHGAGHYKMDVEKLKSRLNRAQLYLGNVEETMGDFIKSSPAPVAFVSIDVDLYSSTMHALRLLDASEELLMPRIYFYFDDIMGPTKNEYAGERLAIAEFSKNHTKRKITPIYGLKFHLPKPHSSQVWVEKSFMAHIFDHKKYGIFDGITEPEADLSLRER